MVKFVKNRIEPILYLLKDKIALDLGCVGMGKYDTIGGENWLFGKAAKVARKLVGVDINEDGVKGLQKLGYTVMIQDVEKQFDLKEKFDVVTANEVIEHLSNPGIFLENVQRHLKENGLFILTTPNALSHTFFLQRLLFNKIVDVSINHHTHWHTEETLKTLLCRYNFEIKKIWCVHPEAISKKWWYYFIKLLWYFVPDRFGRNIICIAKNLPRKKNEPK